MKRQDVSTQTNPKPTLAELNAMFEEERKLDWVAIDRQINKDTGTWKRVQEIIGVPRSPETKQKISDALKGHGVSAVTRRKISTSLRKFHEHRNRGLAEGRTTPPNSTGGVGAPSTTWSRSIQALSALLRPTRPDGVPVERVNRQSP